MTVDPTRRLAALGGVLGPAAFIATWAALGLREGYSPMHDPISRLASTDSSTRWAMTSGFLAFAVGTGAFSPLLRTAVSPGTANVTVACALGTIGIAATPLGSVAGGAPHAIAAGATYASLAATPLLAARPLAAAGRRKAAFTSAAVALVTTACLTASVATATRTGLWQRLGLLAGDLWFITMALHFLRVDTARRDR